MGKKTQAITFYIPWMFFAFFAFFAVLGCTTIQTTDLPPAHLSNQIILNELIKNEDYVTIITVDGIRYKLKVLEVAADRILGEEIIYQEGGLMEETTLDSFGVTETKIIEVKIVDIVSIETKELTAIGTIVGFVMALGAPYLISILVGAMVVL